MLERMFQRLFAVCHLRVVRLCVCVVTVCSPKQSETVTSTLTKTP